MPSRYNELIRNLLLLRFSHTDIDSVEEAEDGSITVRARRCDPAAIWEYIKHRWPAIPMATFIVNGEQTAFKKDTSVEKT